MLPLSGARNPATNDISVVLPAPFGPSNPKNSPRASESETRSKATISPKRFVTFSIVNIDVFRFENTANDAVPLPRTIVQKKHKSSKGSQGGGSLPTAQGL